MKKQLSILVSSMALAFLAACGGGGGDGSTTVVAAATVDKYVGTWTDCQAQNPGSRRQVVTITRVADTSASFSQVDTFFANSTDCSGTATGTESTSGTVVWTGTATIGANTVDKGVITEGANTQKQVFLVTAATLRTG